MLGLNYKNEEQLNKEIFSGKLQREIFNYIKEIYLNHEIYPEMCTSEINKENVYDYFDAQIGDMYIEDEMICSPGRNKYVTIFHNLIEAVYEEFMIEKALWWEQSNYKEVTINAKMDSTELYKLITYVTTFEKVEEGHYLNYIKSFDFNYKDAEIIYDKCHEAWLKDDSGMSLDHIISSISQSINDRKINLQDIKVMSKYHLLDAVSNDNFKPCILLNEEELEDESSEFEM